MTKNTLKAIAIFLSIVYLGHNADAEENKGYFLSLKQKGRLIWKGQIKENDGELYDVSIIPGYTYPAQYGWRNIKQAGSDLSEYVDSEKYKDLWDDSGECLEWVFDDCLYDFTIKGSGRAWKKYFGRARNRVKKRVFGWWLSYPWALMQSAVDNVVRIPLGLVGTVGGSATGVVIVPSYHLINSSAKATWNCGVEGLLLPASGLVWNTVSAPPMALLGQKPSPERVDGFWIRRIQQNIPPSQENLEDIVAWGELLYKNLGAFETERQEIVEDSRKQKERLYDEIRKLEQKARQSRKALDKKENDTFGKIISNDSKSLQAARIENEYWSRNRIRKNKGQIYSALKSAGLEDMQLPVIYTLLMKYQERLGATNIPSHAIKKTDPVRESINVIEDID